MSQVFLKFMMLVPQPPDCSDDRCGTISGDIFHERERKREEEEEEEETMPSIF